MKKIYYSLSIDGVMIPAIESCDKHLKTPKNDKVGQMDNRNQVR